MLGEYNTVRRQNRGQEKNTTQYNTIKQSVTSYDTQPGNKMGIYHFKYSEFLQNFIN